MWAKDLVIVLIAFEGIPLLIFGPLVLLDLTTNFFPRIPTSNRDSYCTPTLFGECD